MVQYAKLAGSAITMLFLYILCLTLFVACLRTLKGSQFPRKVTLPYLRSWKFWALYYVVIIVEIAVLFVLVRYCDTRHMPQAMWPLIVAVVGLHWGPLGWLNGVRLWYYIAGFLAMMTLIIVLSISSHATVQALGVTGNAWDILSVGLMIVSMLITSVVCLRLLKRALA